jgi:hypothetical protein
MDDVDESELLISQDGIGTDEDDGFDSDIDLPGHVDGKPLESALLTAKLTNIRLPVQVVEIPKDITVWNATSFISQFPVQQVFSII